MRTVVIRYHGEFASRTGGKQEELAVSEETGVAGVMVHLQKKYSIEPTDYYIKRNLPLAELRKCASVLKEGEILDVFPITTGGLLSQTYSKGYISKF